MAAADGQVRRQVAGDGLGDAAAGGAVSAGRAQHLPESFGVTQVFAGVVPVEPGNRNPGQRLVGGGCETFLLVLFEAIGMVEDRGGVIQSVAELQELQVVGVGEADGVVEVVLAGDGDDGVGGGGRGGRVLAQSAKWASRARLRVTGCCWRGGWPTRRRGRCAPSPAARV